MKFKGFVGGSYEARAITFDAQRCVNLFAETDESQMGKDGQIGFLIGTPGLKTYIEMPAAGRAGGLYAASNGRLFSVNGSKLYEIRSSSSYIELGNLTTNSGPVCITDNGVQLVVVDGLKGYLS